jgi:hypothetical protein
MLLVVCNRDVDLDADTLRDEVSVGWWDNFGIFIPAGAAGWNVVLVLA